MSIFKGDKTGVFYMKSAGLISLFILSSIISAQNLKLSGKIIDSKDTNALPGVLVTLKHLSDTSKKQNVLTDINGNFEFIHLTNDEYELKGFFLGYKPLQLKIADSEKNLNLGVIKMTQTALQIKGVNIETIQERAKQMGDTTQFNADAYKVHKDANAEDLVTKLPGVTNENGTVKVNGEDVKQVLIDGKPFLGDDPNAALKNLPAEVIDKIQVFDKQSDQAQFTGFDDGQSSKTINIVTRGGLRHAKFGKLYSGYGTDDHYSAGGNINLFEGDRRITIIGQTNNINQQNFSAQDLLGISGQSGGQGRGGPGGGGGRGGRGSSGGSSGGGGMGGGDAGSNFLVNQQNGIATTHAIGFNYTDYWGKKIKISNSYFFNQTNNNSQSILSRNYISSRDSGLHYNETSLSNTTNNNHRFNLKLEYTIDSSNSIIYSPKVNVQLNNSGTTLNGNTTLLEKINVSTSNNKNTSDNTGYTLSNNLLYRHKFSKKGRTFSLNFSNDRSNKETNGNIYSFNEYYLPTDTLLTDQQSDQLTKGENYSASIIYTEPIDSFSQLEFNLRPSYNYNNTDKKTYNLQSPANTYTRFDTTLSNKYENIYFTNRAGTSYRFNKGKMNFSVGLSYQNAVLNGNQQFPYAAKIEKTFHTVLPNMMLNYKINKTKNIRLMYRTNNNAPSITQLQNVVDNRNTLLLSTGNPDLQQDYSHNVTIRYGNTNGEKGRGLFLLFMGSLTQNYIGNSTITPYNDSTLSNGMILKRGSQLSLPVNLNGNYNTRAFITYALPLLKIKCNLNLNAGFTYNRIPALINNNTNLSNNYTPNAGIVLSSNISQNIDFTLSYSGNFSVIQNSLKSQSISNSNYMYHTISGKLNYTFLSRFIFNTQLTQNRYTGLSQSYNQIFLLWNASLGYKFLKDQNLEAKLSVYDLLDQNKSINRNVTETYIEDSSSNILNRYFLFTLTYTFRKFGKVKEDDQPRDRGRKRERRE